MADATLQILGLGSSAVPLDYNVTGDSTLDLLAVTADFDGSGAGVDFVPMVEIVSAAGAVMAQSQGPTVPAGSSATVCFAPFLEQPVTSAPSASIVVEHDLYVSGGNLILNAGASGFLKFAYANGTLNPVQILNTTVPDAPTLLKGLYMIEFQVFPTTALNANKTFGVEAEITAGFNYLTDQASVPVPAAYLDPLGKRQGVLYSFQWQALFDGATFTLAVVNGDTAPRAFFIGHCNVIRMTGWTF